MHILQFICSTGFYGAERWILALCNNTQDPNVTYSLAVTDEVASKNLEIAKHFKRDCGDVFELPMAHKFDYKAVTKLANYIKKNNIDAVHTHGYKSDVIGVLAAKIARVPVIVTPHGFENAKDVKLRLFIWLGCQAMKFADHVVPLSPQLVEDCKHYSITEPQLVYIQNGVDLSEVERFKNKPLSLTKTKKRVGFIGQMISRKNIIDLLDVFNALHKKMDNVELVLLGDGDSRATLEEYTQTLESKDDIHFLGYRDDRLDYLKSFDLFVMTSTLEGIPRCLMEACAMETPVAAYDIAGIDQLITHENTGLLARLGDKASLLLTWEKILKDEKYASKLGINACNYVNQHYSAKRMADEYIALFNQILDNKEVSL
ncbi:MAG: glycosyltransferase involved in cell wall biosynthesis [Glaciecola sp.]|jgi:glycosyltransferase involved in cell wall biosynthesis